MAMLSLLQAVINRLLALDPDTGARLAELDSRVIRLRLRLGDDQEEVALELDVLPTAAGGVRLRVPPGASQADVTISGNPAVFGRALFGEVHPSASASLELRGDVELGKRFEQILKRLDIDWEELAAHAFGDVVARQLGNAARGLRTQAAATAHTLERDLAEYLQEEARLTAPRSRVEAFLRAVDRLRADADRLEKRVERLQEAAPWHG